MLAHRESDVPLSARPDTPPSRGPKPKHMISCLTRDADPACPVAAAHSKESSQRGTSACWHTGSRTSLSLHAQTCHPAERTS